MFPSQGAVHRCARSFKRQWHQQMSGAGDRPTERDDRLACHRVCDGEHGRDALAESVTTCRVSSSMRRLRR
jgi:hypothetical protein